MALLLSAWTLFFKQNKSCVVIHFYGGGALEKEKWVLCPICNNKTRIKVRPDTVLENFPLYCPKCKQETIINVTGQSVVTIKSSGSK